MKLLLILLVAAQSFGEQPRVTCKTCNFAIQAKTKKHTVARIVQFVAPVAAGIAIGRAVAPGGAAVKLTPVVGNRVVSFCIVGQTC
jgi:hypothetical protein